MSPLNVRELEQEVRAAAPEPPSHLLQALLDDAPDSLLPTAVETAEAVETALPVAPGGRRSPYASWRFAASLVTVLAGGMLAWVVSHRAPPLSTVVDSRAETQPEPGNLARTPATASPEDAGSGAPLGRTSAAAEVAQPPAALPAASPGATAPARAPVSSLVVEVRDDRGAALPGATVVVAGGPAPVVAVTDSAGRAKFLALGPGSYGVEARLEGFSALAHDLRARPGNTHRLAMTLSPAVEDVITVTAESPNLDPRFMAVSAATSGGTSETIPTSRDPWAILQKLPGALADRIDVAGNETGQQSRGVPSTGGTAEPNGAPYGDVFYRGYGVNPFLDTEDDALSTFGLDVDTASYNVVRRYLTDGNLPPPEAVRLEELVNAFDYGDPAPRRGDFALRAEGAPSPWGAGERYYLLRLAVKAREVSATERQPADLVFVVDVSGSMANENRLLLVQKSLHLLLDELRGTDRVALVVYGSRGEVRLPFTTDRKAIGAAIDRLAPEGSTNVEEGLVLAYDLAAQEGRRDAMRRIVLCSDGVANVGATGPEQVLARIGAAAREGIELTTVGFGMGNYNDVLMEQLADRGDGRYAYVDTLPEARRIFVENLTGTLQTVAFEARAQVEFDPRTVARWRLVGYENRDIADERFRDDTVDAGEIGAGHSVTALYEIKLHPGAEAFGDMLLGTLRLRWRPAAGETHEESTLPLRGRNLARSWAAGSHAFRLASVVARFAEVLRDSFWARNADLQRLAEDARGLAAERPDEPRIAELAELVARAAELRHSERDKTEKER
jgi:Ca-activated chloride channel family protein